MESLLRFKKDRSLPKMKGSNSDLIKVGVVTTAFVGVVVYTQYKYSKLEERLSKAEADIQTLAKYVKLLEARLRQTVAAGNNGPSRIVRNTGQEEEESSSEENDPDNFSDTDEEPEPPPKPAEKKKQPKAPAAQPARVHNPHPTPHSTPHPMPPHAHHPHPHPTPHHPPPHQMHSVNTERKSSTRSAIPIPQKDIETRERIEDPPASSIRRNEKAKAPVDDDEDDSAVMVPAPSNKRVTFDDDIDGGSGSSSDSAVKNRASALKARADARAKMISERSKQPSK